MIRFTHNQWSREIERLSTPLRAVFAAACAERLMPQRAAVSSAEERIRISMRADLAYLWRDLSGGPMEASELRLRIDRCMVSLGDEIERDAALDSDVLEGAGLTLAYALRCRERGEAQEAVWAAQCAYEARLGRRAASESRVRAIDDREAGRSEVQIELARQLRDLGNLQGVGASDVRDAIARIRLRAQQERRAVSIPVSAFARGA